MFTFLRGLAYVTCLYDSRTFLFKESASGGQLQRDSHLLVAKLSLEEWSPARVLLVAAVRADGAVLENAIAGPGSIPGSTTLAARGPVGPRRQF